MAQENSVTLSGSNGGDTVVKGTYRQIAQKIKNILVNRKDESFLVRTVTDKSGSVVENYGFTDISNFLHELEYDLIPKEEMEDKKKHLYRPMRFVNL